MEQDLKILETIVNYRKFDGIYSTNEVIFKAIEHLIKAYKELEEENRYLKTHIIYPEIIKLNYIPVSLVEEKIEELDNQIKEVTNNIENSVDEEKAYWKKEKHDLNMQRYVLQELLEKRK